MSLITSRPAVLAVGAVCAAAGVGAGAIATAGASSSSGQSSSGHSSAQVAAAHGAGAKAHRRRALVRRAVHGTFVVHTKSGFKTATVDRGTVDSVSGTTLTMTDGTPKASYQKQTITIPSTARVHNDRKDASLSSLSAGERVLVVQAPKRTVVIARPAKTAS